MQVRVPEDDMAELLRKLCFEDMSWEDAKSKYTAEAASSE